METGYLCLPTALQSAHIALRRGPGRMLRLKVEDSEVRAAGSAAWEPKLHLQHCSSHLLLKSETSTQQQKYPGDLLCNVITANSINRGCSCSQHRLQDQGFQPQFSLKSRIGYTTNTTPSWLEQNLPSPQRVLGLAPEEFWVAAGWSAHERFCHIPLPFDIQTTSLFFALVSIGVGGNCLWLGTYVLAFSSCIPCTYIFFTCWGLFFCVLCGCSARHPRPY